MTTLSFSREEIVKLSGTVFKELISIQEDIIRYKNDEYMIDIYENRKIDFDILFSCYEKIQELDTLEVKNRMKDVIKEYAEKRIKLNI